ncbi:MAG: hypothetical protein Ta2E_01180 [Mycoplasmoidaceae bacterium]|nr:MAG: hypothetical protein Ta2E_01180 [Mycoplasmoidaceae bacterium]
MKYFGNDNDIVEFASDIIMDALPLKHLDKIGNNLCIICSVNYVDEHGNQHAPKTFVKSNVNANNTPKKLILMLDHYMPNITLEKTINTVRKKNIRLSKLMSYII